MSGNEKGDPGLPLCSHTSIPLLIHCREGNLPAVKFCVENGASPLLDDRISIIFENGDESDFYHPLHMAADAGHLNIMKYLCTVGCDLHEFGDCALMAAACENHPAVVLYILREKVPQARLNWCLMNAATNGNCVIGGFAIDSGAEVNMCDDYDERAYPFNRAVVGRHYEFVKMLIARGSNPITTDLQSFKWAKDNWIDEIEFRSN